jgi:GGDEF domain-containing protein
MGGDEFAALLEPVDGIEGAEVWARRMANAVEQPFALGDESIPIRVSVGTALAGSDGKASLAEADKGLYRDKPDHYPPRAAVSLA